MYLSRILQSSKVHASRSRKIDRLTLRHVYVCEGQVYVLLASERNFPWKMRQVCESDLAKSQNSSFANLNILSARV